MALNALELSAADARTGRLSCPPPTREAFFAARREHHRNFLLNELGPATIAAWVRAAVSTGNDAAEPPTPPAGGMPPSSAPRVDWAAQPGPAAPSTLLGPAALPDAHHPGA